MTLPFSPDASGSGEYRGPNPLLFEDLVPADLDVSVLPEEGMFHFTMPVFDEDQPPPAFNAAFITLDTMQRMAAERSGTVIDPGKFAFFPVEAPVRLSFVGLGYSVEAGMGPLDEYAEKLQVDIDVDRPYPVDRLIPTITTFHTPLIIGRKGDVSGILGKNDGGQKLGVVGVLPQSYQRFESADHTAGTFAPDVGTIDWAKPRSQPIFPTVRGHYPRGVLMTVVANIGTGRMEIRPQPRSLLRR